VWWYFTHTPQCTQWDDCFEFWHVGSYCIHANFFVSLFKGFGVLTPHPRNFAISVGLAGWSYNSVSTAVLHCDGKVQIPRHLNCIAALSIIDCCMINRHVDNIHDYICQKILQQLSPSWLVVDGVVLSGTCEVCTTGGHNDSTEWVYTSIFATIQSHPVTIKRELSSHSMTPTSSRMSTCRSACHRNNFNRACWTCGEDPRE